MSSPTADKIVDCIRAADYPALKGLLAPDAVLDVNLPTWRFQHKGIEPWIQYFADQTGGLRNLRCTQLEETIAGGTVVVESECRFDGDDGEYLWRCVDIFSIEDEKITNLSEYCTGCWSPDDIARQAVEAPMVAW